MPIPERETGVAGIALLDHPANPGYPSPWRVDDNYGIAPSRCITGEWSLAGGESTVSFLPRFCVCRKCQRQKRGSAVATICR